MIVKFPCPKCGNKNSVDHDWVGKMVFCGRCRAEIAVPFPKPIVIAELDSAPAEDAKPGLSLGIRFRCGSCDARNEIDREWAGKQVRCGSCGIDLLVPSGRKASTEIPKPAGPRSSRVAREVNPIEEDEDDEDDEPSTSLDVRRAERLQSREIGPRNAKFGANQPERPVNFWGWFAFAVALILVVAMGVAILVSTSRPSKRNETDQVGGHSASTGGKEINGSDSSSADADRPALPDAPKAPDRSLENDPDALAHASSAYYKDNARWVENCAAILVERYRFDHVFRVTIDGLDQPEERDAILEALRGCFEGMNGAHAEGLISKRTIRGVFAPSSSVAAFAKGLEFGRPINIDVNENDLTIRLSKRGR